MTKVRRGSPGVASRLASLGAGVLKIAAWVVAVPALCIAVGAAPLYFLLPEDKPQAALPVAAKPMVASVSTPAAVREPAAPAESAATTGAADLSVVGSISPSAEEPAAETEDAIAPMPEDAAASRPEPAVAVVPTPRPQPPAPLPKAFAPPPVPAVAATPAAKPPTRLASIEPTPQPPRRDKPEAKAASAGERAVIRRDVRLRSGPWGREVGVLEQGTPVAVVGRCAEWCEVRAGGTRGWVHPSFLTGGSPAKRTVGDRARSGERREADRRPQRQAREARARARAQERRYYEEIDPREPGWFVEDEEPIVVERRRPPPARFYEPEYYIPY